MSIYDYGQWYRFSVNGYNTEGEYIHEFIYTINRYIVKDEEFKKQMISKGYTYYFCDQRVRGGWKISRGTFDLKWL